MVCMRILVSECIYNLVKVKGGKWNFYKGYDGYSPEVLGIVAFVILDKLEVKGKFLIARKLWGCCPDNSTLRLEGGLRGKIFGNHGTLLGRTNLRYSSGPSSLISLAVG